MYFRSWQHIGAAGITFFIALLVSCFVCVRCAPAGQRIESACWLLLLTLLPAVLELTAGDRLPLRTFLGAATVLCCLLLLAYSACSALPLYRRMVAVLATLVVMQGMYVNAVAQARGWAVARHDQALAAALYGELVRQNVGEGSSHPIRVHFSGMQPFGEGYVFLNRHYPIENSTTTGASFFAWDGGNFWRIVGYMNLLGYTDLQPFDPQPQEAVRAAYASMPSWPAPGSVTHFEGGFLVKLSPRQ
jgi:hypothetical protein